MHREALAFIALALTWFGASSVPTAALLAGWGSIGTAAPVGWWTWLSKVMPDDAEAGGGVAAIQLAITARAAFGGFLYDMGGHQAAFTAAAVIPFGSGLVAYRARARAAAK